MSTFNEYLKTAKNLSNNSNDYPLAFRTFATMLHSMSLSPEKCAATWNKSMAPNLIKHRMPDELANKNLYRAVGIVVGMNVTYKS